MQFDDVSIKGQETLVMLLSRDNSPCTSMCYTQGYIYLILLDGLWKVDIASQRKALTQVEQGEGLCGVSPYTVIERVKSSMHHSLPTKFTYTILFKTNLRCCVVLEEMALKMVLHHLQNSSSHLICVQKASQFFLVIHHEVG